MTDSSSVPIPRESRKDRMKKSVAAITKRLAKRREPGIGTCTKCGHQQEMHTPWTPMASSMAEAIWRCAKCSGQIQMMFTTYGEGNPSPDEDIETLLAALAAVDPVQDEAPQDDVDRLFDGLKRAREQRDGARDDVSVRRRDSVRDSFGNMGAPTDAIAPVRAVQAEQWTAEEIRERHEDNRPLIANSIAYQLRQTRSTAERLTRDVNDLASVIEKETRPQDDRPPCVRCGGPHPFDTTVPSVQWNKVIRGGGAEIPDYLCATCILRAFLDAGVSFTANIDDVPIEVRIDGQEAWDAMLISAENTSLRARIRELEIAAREPRTPQPPASSFVNMEQLAARFEMQLGKCQVYGPADAMRDTWNTLYLLIRGLRQDPSAAPPTNDLERYDAVTVAHMREREQEYRRALWAAAATIWPSPLRVPQITCDAYTPASDLQIWPDNQAREWLIFAPPSSVAAPESKQA